MVESDDGVRSLGSDKGLVGVAIEGRDSPSLPTWAAVLTVPVALAIAVLGLVYTLDTTVPASAIDGTTGWDALGAQDYRLAADYFIRQAGDDGSSVPGLEGAVCVTWYLGYQDHALWLHQLYVIRIPRHLIEARGYDNRCARLEDWGVTVLQLGDPGPPPVVIAGSRDDPMAVELDRLARDSSVPNDVRLLAVACLNDKMGFRVLTSTHLNWFALEPRSEMMRELGNREGSTLSHCLDQMRGYEWVEQDGDGFWVSRDLPRLLFVPGVSPIVRSELLIDAPFPHGPDGQLIEGGGGSGV